MTIPFRVERHDEEKFRPFVLGGLTAASRQGGHLFRPPFRGLAGFTSERNSGPACIN